MSDIDEITREVLDFWFVETPAAKRFATDPAFDADLHMRFYWIYEDIQTGGHERYMGSANSILAAIIVLDQFSRNMFRNQPQAFAEDHRAIALAIYAADNGLDQEIAEGRRAFLYMPFMHSENPADHDRAVMLFTGLGNDTFLEFELKHKAIIDQFGRYPHRNAVLGRKSTEAELAHVAEHGGF